MTGRSKLLAIAIASVTACACKGAGGLESTDPPDGSSPSLAALLDGAWDLTVDRAWDGTSGNIQQPTDPLTEADYQPVGKPTTYHVVFTLQTTRVAVGTMPMRGMRTQSSAASMTWDLSENTFAGGRFEVWPGAKDLQAELTIYGSGKPIATSERGALTASQ